MNTFTYTDRPSEGIVNIPITLLRHHPDNPRKDLGDLSELAASIKAKGVMQNLTVVPFRDEGGTGCYYVVIGNRRMEASKQAGLETLPCVISDMTVAEQVQTMLLENMQRVNLTVYEQAAGFQMMMDFGDSVKQISEKTGFSENTVRHRLKMAELDMPTLKKVSDRQLSLADFDRLAEIEDLGVRNKVLEHIGTNNFDWHLSKAKESQKNARLAEAVRQKLLAAGLTEITREERTGRKDLIGVTGNKGSQFRVDTTPLDSIVPGTYAGEGHLFYFDYEIWCYVVGPKTEEDVQKKDAFDEQNRERERRYAALEEANERAYHLRLSFVKGISEAEAKKHFSAALPLIALTHSYHDHKSNLKELFGIEEADDAKQDELLTAAVEASPYRTVVFLGFSALYGLSCSNYTYNWRCTYSESKHLCSIYNYLQKLGYCPCDEELALVDGTSDLYLREESNG